MSRGSRQAGMVLDQELSVHIVIRKEEAERLGRAWAFAANLKASDTPPPRPHLLVLPHRFQSINWGTGIQVHESGAGAMAQWLLTVLPEDPGWMTTPNWQLTTVCSSRSWHYHTDVHKGKNINAYNTFKSKCFKIMCMYVQVCIYKIVCMHIYIYAYVYIHTHMYMGLGGPFSFKPSWSCLQVE